MEVFPEIIKILKNKNIIIQKLSIKELNPDYFKNNNITVPDLGIEENILMYRKWNAEEITHRIKMDSLGNMINLEDFAYYHIFNHKTYVTLDFLYKINTNIYIPMSFAFTMKNEIKSDSLF